MGEDALRSLVERGDSVRRRFEVLHADRQRGALCETDTASMKRTRYDRQSHRDTRNSASSFLHLMKLRDSQRGAIMHETLGQAAASGRLLAVAFAARHSPARREISAPPTTAHCCSCSQGRRRREVSRSAENTPAGEAVPILCKVWRFVAQLAHPDALRCFGCLRYPHAILLVLTERDSAAGDFQASQGTSGSLSD